MKEINKLTLKDIKVDDMLGWLLPNMFINTQMMMSTDTDGNFCMESYRFYPGDLK